VSALRVGPTISVALKWRHRWRLLCGSPLEVNCRQIGDEWVPEITVGHEALLCWYVWDGEPFFGPVYTLSGPCQSDAYDTYPVGLPSPRKSLPEREPDSP